jgi:hypothetical protein
VLALVVPVILAFLPAPLWDASRVAGAVGGLVPHAFTCFALGSVIALPIVAVIAALDRGGQRMSAILLAASAGLAANLLLENKCLISDPGHLILGHAPVIALYVLVAAGITALRRRR